jgi:hypothetical protein
MGTQLRAVTGVYGGPSWPTPGQVGLPGQINRYDDLGRRTAVQRRGESLVDASTVYSWDGAGRLTSLSFNLSGTSQDATWTLGYNPAGQVVSRALSNSAYAYTADPNLSDAYTINGLNQVTAVDTTSVTYDGRGNITGDGTSTWTYDSANRIVSGGASTLAYDPAGRLGQITSTGVDNRFLYAGAQAIGEYNGSGGLIRRYVPGAGLDDYAAYTSGTGGSITRSWPMADPLGSVAAIADAAGAAIKINRYDEYGVPQSGTPPPLPQPTRNPRQGLAQGRCAALGGAVGTGDAEALGQGAQALGDGGVGVTRLNERQGLIQGGIQLGSGVGGEAA